MKEQKGSRLRAAPSPTGYVHIGNLRTFLYDFLFSKKNNGKLILRIEDTDQERKVEKGIESIIEVLGLYGITFDESPVIGGDYGPYIQTERIDIYKEHAERLIDKGFAYRCFCTEERLAEMRDEQQKKGLPTGYDGHCRKLSDEESKKRAEKESYVVRMKFPEDGESKFKDLVYGEITVPNNTIDDQILLKSDGLPTYHFAVVVDDHLMDISHVVRGREYLADTPKNIFLYEAFGWDIPIFVHVPHILKPQGKGKLGKRDGALPAYGYIKKGYLPEAILNYIALIGWSPAPQEAKQDEIYTLDELIEVFDFKGIHKAGGRYDPKKLDNTNAKHIRMLNTEELADKVIDWAEYELSDKNGFDDITDPEKWEIDLDLHLGHYLPLWKADREYFLKALSLVHERLTYFSQLPDLLDFFYDDELEWHEGDWKNKDRSYAEIATALEEIYPELEDIFNQGDFSDHQLWEKVVRGYADSIGWKHGEIFLAIRSATTGRLQSPPLLESFEVIGWDQVSKNLKDAISWLKTA